MLQQGDLGGTIPPAGTNPISTAFSSPNCYRTITINWCTNTPLLTFSVLAIHFLPLLFLSASGDQTYYISINKYINNKSGTCLFAPTTFILLLLLHKIVPQHCFFLWCRINAQYFSDPKCKSQCRCWSPTS